MITFLSYLYAVVPVVVIAGWAPQIVALLKDPRSGRSMSVGTWAIWSVSGFVGTAYGVFVLRDWLVTATFFANLVGQVTILVCAIWARWVEGREAQAATVDVEAGSGAAVDAAVRWEPACRAAPWPYPFPPGSPCAPRHQEETGGPEGERRVMS